MKRLFLPRLAAASLLLGAALAGSAFAQAGKPAARSPDISGRWLFKTELRNKGCTISGEMTFKKSPQAVGKAAGYSCSFVAREECGAGATRTWSEVQQSCAATETAGEFLILSKVEKVLAAYPAGYKDAIIANNSYQPDHFRVKPAKNGDLVGHFKSINEADVRFWRDEELVS